ncbi:alpha/beta fold hydrolase [Natrinema salifodinae]|uniref:Pimeloyl-ACP methyl ester carboxylesterase n=1 Tax=Natrinema salifodinae TaxID=1202768 RepID=A0A1I0N0F9_9EURY|nr:alpha/beta hydrolase [Natrinema salifodinae]SEV93829.1 Pimeloyl-ACP methyl ester carboxylesterase [Natrinema salifodinae]
MSSTPRASATADALEAAVPRSVDATATRRTVDGVELHVVAAGDDSAPLVVLLHGFPEFWYGWRTQIGPLVEAGYRVLVPDQRGYNLSEKPAGVRPYRTRELSRDVAALIATEGRDRAHVVGHDWGGLVAWDLARRHPAVVDRLAIINAPHPTAYRRQLLANPEQLRRSWYAAGFQLPWLPERICRYDDYRLLERALRGTAAPGTFSDDDLARYRRAWDRAGALTGMLNWYRAAARYPPRPSTERVDAPTLVVWGADDVALVSSLAVDSAQFCRDSRVEVLPETSHWVPHEKPARLATLLREHFGSPDAGRARG